MLRIIVGIVMIDRDHLYISDLYNGILQNISKYDYEIMIVIRKSDNLCIQKWSEYKDNNKAIKLHCIAHYDTPLKKRHNINSISKLAEKRNIIRKYALINNFDYLWFIDSDIQVKSNCLDILLDSIHNANVSYIPYKIRWIGFPIVGILDKGNLKVIKIGKDIDLDEPYKICHFVGFGMTLLDKSVLDTEIKYQSINIKISDKIIKHEGEDFGFCLELFKDKKTIVYCYNHTVKHLKS